MVRRLNLAEFDVWANDPVMLSERGADPSLAYDNSALFADPQNIALEHDGGCMPFVCHPNNTFDMHFLFPPAMRGIRALNAAKAMVQWVFTSTPARRITGTISRGHRAARWFIIQLGFVHVATSPDGKSVTYAAERDKWPGSAQQFKA